MVDKIKTNKLTGFNFYVIWLIAFVTFCIVVYVLTSLMGSSLLYVPGFIVWGVLSYWAVMALRGRYTFLLLLADGYMLLAALVYCSSLLAVGFLNADDSTAYAIIVAQFCFAILALIFAFMLRHVYGVVSSLRQGLLYRILNGILWVTGGGMAVIGALVALSAPVYVADSVEVGVPLMSLGLICMLSGIVSKKRLFMFAAFGVFAILGIASTATLLQDSSQKQYLYVTASICILALLSLALGLSWRRVRKS